MNAQIKSLHGQIVVLVKEPGSRKRAQTWAVFSTRLLGLDEARSRAMRYVSQKQLCLVSKWPTQSSSQRSQVQSQAA